MVDQTNPDRRPVPTNDGIEARIESGGFYDYWYLRDNGDFFLLRSLHSGGPELGRPLFYDATIAQITEALLYCRRLYERLGVTPRAEVRISIGFGGLLGRQLATVRPFESAIPAGVSTADETRKEAEVVLGRIDNDLVQLVKSFAAPLFEIFDFTELPDALYENIVRSLASQ